MLFSVGGLFALYEAYHKFHEIRSGHEEAVDGWKSLVPVVVLLIAIGLESFSFRTAIQRDQQGRGRRVVPPVRPAREVSRSCR